MSVHNLAYFLGMSNLECLSNSSLIVLSMELIESLIG